MKIDNLTILTLNSPEIKDFSAARNALLKDVKTEWILFLDSDEQLSSQLIEEIRSTINNLQSNNYSAYYLPRQDLFLGKILLHGETGKAKFIRLARKDWGHWERPVHEVWVGEGRVGTLKNPILHTPHDISTFLTKIDNYSTIESKYRYSKMQKSSLLHIFTFPIAKFLYNFIFRLGFLDGVAGIIHAIMMSFHSYLTWTKLYLLWHQK